MQTSTSHFPSVRSLQGCCCSETRLTRHGCILQQRCSTVANRYRLCNCGSRSQTKSWTAAHVWADGCLPKRTLCGVVVTMSDTRAHLRTSSLTKQPAPASYTLVLQSEPAAAANISAAESDYESIYNKISWRLLPLFMSMLMLNWLDRSCLAFASIQMTQELHFSPEVYGLASGLFFLSYCLLQVPANYCCMRLGVSRWFTTIMVLFGVIAASFATVQQPWQLYVLRLLLGAAEAGSFPGVWYAISLWFPPDRIAFPYSLMGASVAISQIVAAPVAAALLKLDGCLGLSGWQWVFVGEGIPSVLLGVSLPWLLPPGPHALEGNLKHCWLTQQELQLLKADYAAKVSDLKNPFTSAMDGECLKSSAPPSTAVVASPSGLQLLLQICRVWQMWYLAVCNILKDIGNVGLMMWLPVMLHAVMSGADPLLLAGDKGGTQQGESGSPADTGTTAVLLSAIPFTCAGMAVVLSGYYAQRTGRPLWYIIVPCLLGGTTLICFHWVVELSRVLGFCCLIITLSCAFAASPHAPAVIAKLTLGSGSAIALPCYNSVGMLGGLLGPSIMGFCVQHFGGFSVATAVMGGSMALSGLLVLLLQRIMWNNSRTRAIICSRTYPDAASSEFNIDADILVRGEGLGDSYEVVYRSSSIAAVGKCSPGDTELARLVADHAPSAPVVSLAVHGSGRSSGRGIAAPMRTASKQQLHRLSVADS